MVTAGDPPGLRLSELLTLSDETDEAGRLLLEDSAPPAALKAAERSGVAMETAVYHATDTPSRAGGLMNVSAYDALRHDTAAILQGFAWLSAAYLKRDPTRRGTVQALLDVSNMGVTLPLVIFRRARSPVAPHGALPAYIASIFKASRGVFSAAVNMLNRMGGGTAVTAPEVVAFAEEHGHLRRPATGRVCAAPARLIERTIGAILAGDPDDARRSGLGGYVDYDQLWRFYELEESFAQTLSRYRFVLDRLLAHQGGGTGNPGKDLQRYFKRTAPLMVREGGRTGTFGQFTEALIVHANSVQAGLNRALGRTENARPFTFDDLVRTL